MPITPPTKPHTHVNGTKADATKVNANDDTIYSAANVIINNINDAAGSKDSMAKRLEVSMNPDGTMKSGITAGNEWIDPALSPVFVSTTQFNVSGDHTDIYKVNRRVKVDDALYSHITASSYSAGTGLTTVTLKDSILTDPITKIEHGSLSPVIGGNHAFPMDMLLPPGVVVAWIPGYFTDGVNGGYTQILGVNDPAGANAYLNPFGWYVCNGAALNDPDSLIYYGPGRNLPNLTDDRFLMGDTAAGSAGGVNTNAHTHSIDVPTHRHSMSHTHELNHTHTVSIPYSGYSRSDTSTNGQIRISNGFSEYADDMNAARVVTSSDANDATTDSISASNTGYYNEAAFDSGAPSNTENKPKYLSCFYIMKVK